MTQKQTRREIMRRFLALACLLAMPAVALDGLRWYVED